MHKTKTESKKYARKINKNSNNGFDIWNKVTKNEVTAKYQK